jgi:hypothetical protein
MNVLKTAVTLKKDVKTLLSYATITTLALMTAVMMITDASLLLLSVTTIAIVLLKLAVH